jgi:predicted amidohydrolase
MTSALKISIATMAIRRYSDLKQFENHIDHLADMARNEGSDLLLLPELSCVGLLWSAAGADRIGIPDVSAAYRKVLTPLFEAYQQALMAVAQRHGIVIAGASFWHEENGRGLNTGFVVYPNGSVIRQDKLHPTRGEKAIDTSGGNNLATFEIGGVTVGMLICYDLQFPELSRHLVDQGVEILLVPSLTDERGTWRIRHAAHARAIENQMFVCVSPIVGDLGIPVEKPVHGCGAAFVACPIDNRFAIEDGTLARAEDNVESLLHVTLDLELLRKSRQRAEITHLNDRRPDLYEMLRGESPRSGDQ